MIRAAARMAEAELARIAAVRQPWGSATAMAMSRLQARAADGLHLQALGRPDMVLAAAGRLLRLSLRHSEILAVLAAHPGGLSGDELAVMLYPGDVSPATLRAEVVRLRSLLGADRPAAVPLPAPAAGRGDGGAPRRRARRLARGTRPQRGCNVTAASLAPSEVARGAGARRRFPGRPAAQKRGTQRWRNIRPLGRPTAWCR
ncbi:MAG TPA: helix-turn-helix domain-containing protein [Trebonia sp.]